MAWNDRIREAAYTSPNGTRIVFGYENVSFTVEKKTTAFEFPDADGTYVQDLGHSGRRYPFRVFFWGDEYDTEADAFEAALLERGTGKLEHPIYGAVDVVPFGAIKRRDDLKTAANQAVLEVTFWETINVLYPTAQLDPASSVLSAVEEFNAAVATQFGQDLDLETASLRTTFENEYLGLLNSASSGLQAIAGIQGDVRTQFNAIKDSITQGIDILIADPLTLAFQTALLIQAPARIASEIRARLAAYEDLAANIVSGGNEVTKNGVNSISANTFREKDLYALSYLSGSVVSVVNSQFETKTQALEAAELILNRLQSVTEWREDNYESLVQIDTGEAYQQIQEAVALAAGFLVQISFSLKQERSVTLDRARTIIDLSAELYGEIDQQLDFLVSSNNLSGSEILELPRGREIVYYV